MGSTCRCGVCFLTCHRLAQQCRILLLDGTGDKTTGRPASASASVASEHATGRQNSAVFFYWTVLSIRLFLIAARAVRVAVTESPGHEILQTAYGTFLKLKKLLLHDHRHSAILSPWWYGGVSVVMGAQPRVSLACRISVGVDVQYTCMNVHILHAYHLHTYPDRAECA